MKAIRVHQHGGPEVLRLEEVEAPVPGVGEVLVAVKAAGVNPVDTYIRAGSQGYARALPFTPGMDGAGTVEAVGRGVENFKKGDRVYIAGTKSGSYAAKALCAAHQVHPLAARISFAEGACLGVPYATAWRALFQRAKARPGETVLIHGASGGVGLAAVQLARAAGLRVIGTAGTPNGRDLVESEGAHVVLDHGDPKHFAAARAATDDGVNVILEMLANVNLGQDLPILARGGRVVVIGSRGTVEINPRDTMARDAAVFGMALFNATSDELAEVHAALVAGLESGMIRPVVAREFPLAEAAAAHTAVMAGGHRGNFVLTV